MLESYGEPRGVDYGAEMSCSVVDVRHEGVTYSLLQPVEIWIPTYKVLDSVSCASEERTSGPGLEALWYPGEELANRKRKMINSLLYTVSVATKCTVVTVSWCH